MTKKKSFLNTDTTSPAEVVAEDGTNSKEGIIELIYAFIYNSKPTLEGQSLSFCLQSFCEQKYHLHMVKSADVSVLYGI